MNHALRRLHKNEAVAEIKTEVVENLISNTKTYDVAITGRNHRCAIRVGGRIHIVRIAHTAAEVVGEIVFKTYAKAPDIMPIKH